MRRSTLVSVILLGTINLVMACDRAVAPGADQFVTVSSGPAVVGPGGIEGLRLDLAQARSLQKSGAYSVKAIGATWRSSLSLDEYVAFLESQLAVAESRASGSVALEEYFSNAVQGSSLVIIQGTYDPPNPRNIQFYGTTSCYQFPSNTFAYALSNLGIYTPTGILIWKTDSALINSGPNYASGWYPHTHSGPQAVGTMQTKHYCDPGSQKAWKTSSASGGV